MKNIVLGIAAHVDAGKTTLSENMLYVCGEIKKAGRVDHGDTFLDTDDIERKRGITVFSKEATLSYNDLRLRIIDTPGHTDFSSETERALYVLDYALLIVSASGGVQSHTKRLFKLFKSYNIPVFIFVNKMDLIKGSKEDLLKDLKNSLSSDIIDFSLDKDLLLEEAATASDELFYEYQSTGKIKEESIAEAIRERRIFPLTFGSALKGEGINELLFLLSVYTKEREEKNTLSGRAYKITRDEKGNRLTHILITGGELFVRDSLKKNKDHLSETEKITEIREYSGDKYKVLKSAKKGTLCAVLGLSESYPGEGFGEEEDAPLPELIPVLSYSVETDESVNKKDLYNNFKILAEEDPLLSVKWNDKDKTVTLSLMGEIQTTIIKTKFKERFGTDISFGPGKIMYRETILNDTMGHGHFEPLKHFADVTLKISPLPPGSGIVLKTECKTDILDRQYQNQILSALRRPIPGILTASPLTDCQITLISGKSHKKHTEGGDFRKATGIAVRDALLRTECVLLEPFYKIDLYMPDFALGRVMTAINNINGKTEPPDIKDGKCHMTGTVPVILAKDFLSDYKSFTGGEGEIYTEILGYFPCHNPEEVIESIGYNYLNDLNNPYESIYVHRDEVPDVIESIYGERKGQDLNRKESKEGSEEKNKKSLEDELSDIFERTYGKVKRELQRSPEKITGREEKIREARESFLKDHPSVQKKEENRVVKKKGQKTYVLVDGYNVINSWNELKDLKDYDLKSARDRLSDILVNYAGYEGCELILVFDAYKVKGNPGSIEKYQNIYIAYTKEAQTADSYIERATHEIIRNTDSLIYVVTSDGLIQTIVIGEGAIRISSREFEEIVRNSKKLL